MPLLLLPSVPASLSYNPGYNLVNVMTIQEKTFVYACTIALETLIQSTVTLS